MPQQRQPVGPAVVEVRQGKEGEKQSGGWKEQQGDAKMQLPPPTPARKEDFWFKHKQGWGGKEDTREGRDKCESLRFFSGTRKDREAEWTFGGAGCPTCMTAVEKGIEVVANGDPLLCGPCLYSPDLHTPGVQGHFLFVHLAQPRDCLECRCDSGHFLECHCIYTSNPKHFKLWDSFSRKAIHLLFINMW